MFAFGWAGQWGNGLLRPSVCRCVSVCAGVRRCPVWMIVFLACVRGLEVEGRANILPAWSTDYWFHLLPGKWGYKYLLPMEALMTWHTRAHTGTPKQTWNAWPRLPERSGMSVGTRWGKINQEWGMFTMLLHEASITNLEAHDTPLLLKLPSFWRWLQYISVQVKTLWKFTFSAMF